MNRQIFERNMEVLEKKYPVWATILKTYTRKQRNFDVIIEQSYTEIPIMKISDHGSVYYLNGKYAPSAVADRWLKEQEPVDKFAVVIIIGISNGVHIRKIMESVPKTVNILVYEPSYEIFRRAMEEVDLSFLFQPDIPVGIVVKKINGFEIQAYFNRLITYDNLVSVKIFLSGNYQKLFTEDIGDFIDALAKHTESLTVDWNTQVRYTNVRADNLFHNMHYLYEGYSCADLHRILPDDIPVIIVSAGPSLRKNIKDLKAAQGKACIIATDTAMKPLLSAGIVPDLFVIVDGLKPAELFEHRDISKAGMVTMSAVSREPMDMHKGRKFFYASGAPFESELVRVLDAMKDRNVVLPNFPTGGSVATSAYSLGVYMGAKTIILVGQDLALTDNKIHVDGAFKNEVCEIDMDSGAYMEVDAVGGGKVITRNDFNFYREWFEDVIKKWMHIRTIDATEGGALIHGAKNMTLKNAIKKFCIKEYNVKWHLARLPKLFETEEEKKYALDRFEDSANRLEEVNKKAKEGIKRYEKIREIACQGMKDQEKFQKAYEEVKQINDFMENDEMAETVADSLKGLEYTLRPLIYQTQDKKEDEVEEVAQQGIVMLTAMAYAAEEIKGIAEETLVAYARQERCLPG